MRCDRCYQLEMSNGLFKYVWADTRTPSLLNGEEHYGGLRKENEKIRRKGERVSHGKTESDTRDIRKE